MTSPSPSLPPGSRQFYDRLIEERGIDHATDFSASGHKVRFELIRSLLRGDYDRILDYGCNVGDFYDFMCEGGYQGRYFGVDAHAPFVERLLDKNSGNDNVEGECANIMDTPNIGGDRYFDYIVACGVMCHSDQQFQHSEMLARLWNISGKGLIVNFLSEFSPRPAVKAALCRYHPSYAIALVERFKCYDYQLIQGYHAKNDFTLALYK